MRPESKIRDDLRGFVRALVSDVGAPQERAWDDSLRLLEDECAELIASNPEARSWGIKHCAARRVFERLRADPKT